MLKWFPTSNKLLVTNPICLLLGQKEKKTSPLCIFPHFASHSFALPLCLLLTAEHAQTTASAGLFSILHSAVFFFFSHNEMLSPFVTHWASSCTHNLSGFPECLTGPGRAGRTPPTFSCGSVNSATAPHKMIS